VQSGTKERAASILRMELDGGSNIQLQMALISRRR
jgi:hypothetical protein